MATIYRTSDRTPKAGLPAHCGMCGRRLHAGSPTNPHGPTERIRFVCHPRCGGEHVIKRDRLEATIKQLRDEGRDRVVLGVDC